MRGPLYEKNAEQRLMNRIFPDLQTMTDEDKLSIQVRMDNFKAFSKALYEKTLTTDEMLNAQSTLDEMRMSIENEIRGIKEVKEGEEDYEIDLIGEFSKQTGMTISTIQDGIDSGDYTLEGIAKSVADKLGEAEEPGFLGGLLEGSKERWRGRMDYLSDIEPQYHDPETLEPTPFKAYVQETAKGVGDLFQQRTPGRVLKDLAVGTPGLVKTGYDNIIDTYTSGAVKYEDVVNVMEDVIPKVVSSAITAKDVAVETGAPFIEKALDFFPRVADELNVAIKHPKVDQYVNEGMSRPEAIHKVKNEIQSQGGTFYTKSWEGNTLAEARFQYIDAPQKYLHKRQLRGTTPIKELEAFPNKILNPEWVTWAAGDIQSDYDKAIADRVSIDKKYPEGTREEHLPFLDKRPEDIKMASKEFKKNINNFESVEKELRMLKADIQKSQPYKSKLDYKVAIEEVNAMLEYINNLKPELRIKKLKEKRERLMKDIKKLKGEKVSAEFEDWQKKMGYAQDVPYEDILGSPLYE